MGAVFVIDILGLLSGLLLFRLPLLAGHALSYLRNSDLLSRQARTRRLGAA
jgi:hypothetical protein